MHSSVVAVIAETTVKDAAALISNLPPSVVWVELRADYLAIAELPLVPNLFRMNPQCSFIVTLRSDKSGGVSLLSLVERQAFIATSCAQAQLIDIDWSELAAWQTIVPAKRQLVSRHDFASTPSTDMLNRWQMHMQRFNPARTKIATYCHTDHDADRLLDFARHHPLCSVVGMGKTGQRVRREAPGINGSFTFARTGQGIADGQLSIDEALML